MKFALLGAAVFVSSVAACSSSSSPPGDTEDAGPPPGNTTSPEAGTRNDGGPDAGPPDSAPDTSPPPSTNPAPTYLVPSATIDIIGVTTDDFVIYGIGDGTIYAVPTTGGPSQAILSGETASTYVQGAAVFTLQAATGGCAGAKSLITWTAAHGAATISTDVATPASNTEGGDVSVSPDGRMIAYDGWAAGSCVKHEVRVVGIDGTGASTVLLPRAPCAGYAAATIQSHFSADNVLFTLGSCIENGQEQPEVDIFASVSLAPVGSFVGRPTLDPSGRWLWLQLPAGGGELVRSSDGAVVASEPTANDAPAFDSFDQNAYVVTGLGLQDISLSFSNVTSTSIVAPSGVLGALAVDWNGQFLLDEEPIESDAGPQVGYFLRPVTAGGEPVRIDSSLGSGAPTFTVDGTYVLALDGSGVLTSLSPGAVSATHVATDIASFTPLRTKLALAWTTAGGAMVVDASGKTAPWLVAPKVTQAVPARHATELVYTTPTVPAGMYVVAAP